MVCLPIVIHKYNDIKRDIKSTINYVIMHLRRAYINIDSLPMLGILFLCKLIYICYAYIYIYIYIYFC